MRTGVVKKSRVVPLTLKVALVETRGLSSCSLVTVSAWATNLPKNVDDDSDIAEGLADPGSLTIKPDLEQLSTTAAL